MSHINKLGFLEKETIESINQHGGLSQFIAANRVFCFSLFLFLCFLISTLVSIAVSLIVTPTPAPSTKAIMQLSNSLNEIKAEQQMMINNYHVFKEEHAKLKLHIRHSSGNALKSIPMDQEVNFQNFLQTLIAGMRNLSSEIPNGADWYDDYQNQFNIAQKQSIKRYTLLGTQKADQPHQEKEAHK